MSWLRGRNTIIATPIPLNGRGPIRRCVNGSQNMPLEFSASFVAATLAAPSEPTRHSPSRARAGGCRARREGRPGSLLS